MSAIVPGSLAQRLLDSHRMVPSGASHVPSGVTAIAPDAVVLHPDSVPLVIPAFERLGVARAGVDALGVPAEAIQVAFGAPSEQSVELVEWARRRSVRCALPGSGTPFSLALDGYAAPGRVIAGTLGAASGCGALGALAFDLTAGEAALCVAGLPLLRGVGSTVTVRLDGVPPPGVGGVEIAGALAARLAPGTEVVELGGPGVATLPVADRIVVATLGAALTGAAILFPSDSVTATWLESRGRGADWKSFDRGDAAGASLVIALDRLSPSLLEMLPAPLMVDLASRAGHPVAAVLLGPLATAEDLAEFAHALRERPFASGMRVEWRPAGRAQHEALAAAGIEPMLRAAGVVIGESGAPLPVSGAGAHLAFGVDPFALQGPQMWWIAGPSMLAASAIAGVVTPPEVPGVAREVLRGGAMALPRAAEVGEDVPGVGSHPHPEPHGAIPLTVAGVLGDDVSGAEFLPWGARLEALRHDPHALSRHVLDGVDPGFAERARGVRPSLIVGGRALGAGPIHPAAAPALRELGVRAVFAVSFAPEFRRRLIEVGILPLLLPRAAEHDAFACGDRVELPALAASLEPGRALLARNLLRGGRVVLEHDLDPLAIAVVRIGGLLALGREERGRWSRGDAC